MTASMQSAMTFFAIVVFGITLGGCSGEMIANYVIDHIPWWGWAIMIAVPVGALLYFASPIILPLWRMLPLPVKAVIIGLAAGFVAFMGGRYKGRQNAEEEARRRDAQAQQTRTEVEREVDNLSGSEAQKRLRDRWHSDPS